MGAFSRWLQEGAYRVPVDECRLERISIGNLNPSSLYKWFMSLLGIVVTLSGETAIWYNIKSS